MPRDTLIQIRRDTLSNWATVNPILASGEPGLEIETNRTKIGDGVSTWSILPYQNTPFYASFLDTTDQLGSITTITPVTYNTTIDHNEIDLATTSRVRFNYAGLYKLSWSVQLTNTDSADTRLAKMWLRKNGSGSSATGNMDNTMNLVDVPKAKSGTAGFLVSTFNYTLPFAANDYVELVWVKESASVSLAQQNAGTSPTRPAAPSVRLTVNQIA